MYILSSMHDQYWFLVVCMNSSNKTIRILINMQILSQLYLIQASLLIQAMTNLQGIADLQRTTREGSAGSLLICSKTEK